MNACAEGPHVALFCHCRSESNPARHHHGRVCYMMIRVSYLILIWHWLFREGYLTEIGDSGLYSESIDSPRKGWVCNLLRTHDYWSLFVERHIYWNTPFFLLLLLISICVVSFLLNNDAGWWSRSPGSRIDVPVILSVIECISSFLPRLWSRIGKNWKSCDADKHTGTRMSNEAQREQTLRRTRTRWKRRCVRTRHVMQMENSNSKAAGVKPNRVRSTCWSSSCTNRNSTEARKLERNGCDRKDNMWALGVGSWTALIFSRGNPGTMTIPNIGKTKRDALQMIKPIMPSQLGGQRSRTVSWVACF